MATIGCAIAALSSATTGAAALLSAQIRLADHGFRFSDTGYSRLQGTTHQPWQQSRTLFRCARLQGPGRGKQRLAWPALLMAKMVLSLPPGDHRILSSIDHDSNAWCEHADEDNGTDIANGAKTDRFFTTTNER